MASQDFQKEVHVQDYDKGRGNRDGVKGDNNFHGMCGNRKVSGRKMAWEGQLENVPY